MAYSFTSSLIASTLLIGGVAGAQAADAQDAATPAVTPVTPSAPAQAAAAAAPPQEIVVTGSRITNPNLLSTSPINAVSATELRLTGTTRAEDLVAALPQAYASQSSGIANGAEGTATVNLRNLGDTRTLVLLNSHRLPPGDPNRTAGSVLGSAADINNVPSFLVKRVEVLTGGASATYGADAVAGVVNFILDTDLQGFRLDLQGGVFAHDNGSSIQRTLNASGPDYPYPTGSTNDGGNYDASIAYGRSFADGRAHVTVYGSYHKQSAVLQAARDYSSCALSRTESTASLADSLACEGSRNSAAANFITNSGNGSSFIVDRASGLPREFADADLYNYQPISYYQRPDERYNAGLFAHFDVSDAFKPYVDFIYMHDRSLAQIAPSGTFGNIFTINCSNPLLTPAVGTALGCATTGPGTLETVNTSVFKRNVEGGGRIDDLRHEDYRILGGFKGDLGSAWSYDVNAQFGETKYTETYRNDFSFSRARLAINDCLNPDGSPVGDPACQPYNIFTGSTTFQPTPATGVTEAGVNYLQTPGHKNGYTRELVASGTLNGKLGEYGIQSPWATHGVDIAVGAEYRRESYKLNTDIEYSTGDLLGQGGETKPSSGSFDVKEVFLEVSAPLAEDQPFLQKLGADAAYRYSDYSSVGHTNTWKFGLTWQPFDGDAGAVSFRASINRAVRAPTLQDLYAPRQLGLQGSFDTCSGDGPVAPTLANCLNTARNDPNFAAQFGSIASNPASQYNGQTAGAVAAGTRLRPEVAITKTIGVVIAPKGGMLRGFTASIDYYHINLRDTIKTDGYNTIFNQCYNTGSDYYCGLIRRDPANGSLWLGSGGYIIDPVYNSGRLRNSGIDFEMAYTMPPRAWGRLSMNFTGSYLLEEKVEVLQHNSNGSLSSLGFYECAGFYGDNCGSGGVGGEPSPRWRHRLRLTWEAPSGAVSVSGNWRHIGGTRFEGASNDPVDPNYGAGAGPFDRIKAFDYFDMAVTFDIKKQMQFRLGVNNMFDRDPPVIDGADFSNTLVNGNTFPGMYDALGRYVFAAVTAKF